jgi:hypothetical protein
MRRFGYLAALMMLSSSAQAGELHSFVVGGHHVRVEVPRHCASLSCISWSTVDPKPLASVQPAAAPAAAAQPAPAAAAQPAPASAPATIQAPQAPVPQQRAQAAQPNAPAAVSVSCSAPASTTAAATTPSQAPARMELAAATTQTVPPPPPAAEPIKPAVATRPTPQVATQPTLQVAPPPTPQVTPPPSRHEDDTPLGDWRSEGKTGLVRIEQCGRALCGYMLNAATNTSGETVLSNMKSTKAKVWAGDIFSRSSGSSYYARMTLKAPNTLRVEACALGPFFCSGNNWTRVVPRTDGIVISHRATAEPKPKS